MSNKDIKSYLRQLQEVLPKVSPIATASLKALHNVQDFKGMVKIIKDAMTLEDITFRFILVPDGAAQRSDLRNAAAWISLPVSPSELPFYGTAAFKATSLDIHFRISFLKDNSFDQVAIVIAHELSHVVLDSIRHPLKRVEKAVDLTAMLLGFRQLYVSGAHKTRSEGGYNKTQQIGYLSLTEIQIANDFIQEKTGAKKDDTIPRGERLNIHPKYEVRSSRSKIGTRDLIYILAASVAFSFFLGWGLGRSF